MDTLSYMGAYRFAIAVVIVVSALATIFETLGPKVMGRATTLLAEGVMKYCVVLCTVEKKEKKDRRSSRRYAESR